VIVLDSSVLIAHLDANDAQHSRATELLAGIDVDEPLGASTMTLAEVLVGPARTNRLSQAIDALARLGVEEIRWTGDASLVLATIRATTGLKMPDCCVLLAAEQVRGQLATFDKALADTAEQRGIAVLETTL
jgi:predicted nucleic acid-binding protein